MAKLFISYSRIDNENGFVQQIVDTIRHVRRNDEIWWDEELRGGDIWWEKILKAIDYCDIFVYLLSNESINSPYCQAEYAEAQRLNKLILTIQVRGRTEIPSELTEIQYIDMTSGTNNPKALTDLFAALDNLTSAIPKRRRKPRSTVPTPKPTIPTKTEEFAVVRSQIHAPTESLKTERRLDAATPSQTQITDKTEIEVRVKIVHPNSRGLEAELPDIAISGDIIHKRNVVPSNFPIQLEKDDSGHLSASLCIKVQADGFKVRSGFSKGECGSSAAALKVSPNTDSQTITFFLSSKTAPQPQSVRIRVSVLQKGILIAQVPLQTELVKQVEHISLLDYWNFISAIFTQELTQSISVPNFPSPGEQHPSVPESSQPFPKMKKTLSSPTWEGIGAIAGIFAVILGVLALLTPNQPVPTPLPPTQVVIAASNTPVSTSTDLPSATPTLIQTPPPSATPSPIVSRQDNKDVSQVWVESGCFQMGSDPARDVDARPDEQPQHEVCITAGFWIDQFEVSNADYQKFVDSGGYTTNKFWSDEGWNWSQSNKIITPRDCQNSTNGDYPRVGISWYEAEAYARWRGGRLPSEAEWEYAARGPDARIFPWGDTYSDGGYANIYRVLGGAAQVNRFPRGISWVGAHNLAGNVLEWVSDVYDSKYYENRLRDDPINNTGGMGQRVLRGGSWADDPVRARSAFRISAKPETRDCNHGFRVMSAN